MESGNVFPNTNLGAESVVDFVVDEVEQAVD